MAWSNASDVSIRYNLSGRGDRSLILIHELGGSLDSWDAVLPFIDGEFRVLRYDQRGAGLSEKVRTQFTMDDHVRDLEALLKSVKFGPPYCIAAVAAGAAIAIGFAHKHPDWVSAAVLCAAAADVGEDRRAFLEQRAELATREGMRAVADATLARSYAPQVRERNRDIFDDYRGRLLGNDPVCYAMANRSLLDCKLEPVLGTLSCPCLILAGAHDLLRPPADVRALAGSVPGAEFAVIDTGHVMPVQAPRVLSEAMLNFFSKHNKRGIRSSPGASASV
jgi:3-oxoadipate enol-lactonase